MKNDNISQQINNILPQTQCQLCKYPSCKDYANAIAENQASIDKCHPGGLQTLKEISKITKTTYKKYEQKVIKQHKF